MKYLGDEETAKDAVMQVFENLFSGLKKHEIRSFRPWLHAVTKNHCLCQLRGVSYMKLAADELKKDAQRDMESGYVLHLESDEEHQLKELEDAILMLSKEQRICIELFYLKKKPYREIVEITGSTYEQVKSHIQNGKRNLKILLSNRNER
jgi:RNA polymerase sigma factor (sigma-70 family)